MPELLKANNGKKLVNAAPKTSIITASLISWMLVLKNSSNCSENNSICQVTSLGKVTGISKGTCSILVKVKNSNTKNVILTVK